MRFILFIVLIICLGCSSTQPITTEQQAAVDRLLEQKQFVIESDWALPLAVNSIHMLRNAGLIPPQSMPNRINLIGNPNYFKIIGDSIAVDLPFFGDRQMGGGYNSSTSIEFEGIPKEYEVSRVDKKQKTVIKTRFNNTTESFTTVITIFDTKKVEIIIYSTHRSAIRYTGKLRQLEMDSKKDISSL